MSMRLIDADAMLETLKRKYPQWYTRKPKDSWMHYVCLVYYWAVREAPTIDAVPIKHGRWTEGPMCIECSCCGELFSDEIAYMHDPFGKPRYCPCCGSKMDGGDDDEKRQV